MRSADHGGVPRPAQLGRGAPMARIWVWCEPQRGEARLYPLGMRDVQGMSLVVNHNLMALNAARNLSNVFGQLSDSVKRLSSGLRVGSASDDAAGLAIRELMRADIAVLNQGIRNASDAISMIQTADGAMSVIDEKLIRMKELAEQAATGTYTTAQRLIMNSEFQAMAAEVNRISNATDFNGIKLLDGSAGALNEGSGMKIHFGTGNSAAEDYYFVELDDTRTSALGMTDIAYDYEGGLAEVQINAVDGGTHEGAEVAALADGGFVTAWYTEIGGAVSVKGRIYDEDGNAVGEEFEVASTSSAPPRHLSVEGLEDGGFTIVWDQDQPLVPDYRIYGQRYDRYGTEVGSNFQVNTATGSNVSEASVSSLSGGGFVVTWSYSGGAAWDVLGQRYNADGTTNGANFQVNTTVAGDQRNGQVAALNDGGFVVTFASNGTADWRIYGRRYDENGVPEGADYQINAIAANSQTDPSAATLSDGTYIVVWQSNQNGLGDYRIYGRRYQSDGTALDLQGFQINTTSTGDQTNPQVTALADGGFMVNWQSDQTADSRIYGQRFDSDAGQVGSEFQVSVSEDNDQTDPSVAGLTGGDYMTVWSSDHMAVGETDIYGRFYSNTLIIVSGTHISTQSGAQASLQTLDEAILTKDTARAKLGSTQNRLENTITNLAIQAENLQAAESRISDVDVALEMTSFTKNQILAQAAAAMLAQANSLPQLALTLLSA